VSDSERPCREGSSGRLDPRSENSSRSRPDSESARWLSRTELLKGVCLPVRPDPNFHFPNRCCVVLDLVFILTLFGHSARVMTDIRLQIMVFLGFTTFTTF
jgi:hypothetical protein